MMSMQVQDDFEEMPLRPLFGLAEVTKEAGVVDLRPTPGPVRMGGILTRLATHQGAPYCLAVVLTDGDVNKLMRITRETYDAILFGGLMRRRVLCQQDEFGIWSIGAEAH
jgi:hypothetical protein